MLPSWSYGMASRNLFVFQLSSFTSSAMVRTSWWSGTCCWLAPAKSNRPATPEVSPLPAHKGSGVLRLEVSNEYFKDENSGLTVSTFRFHLLSLWPHSVNLKTCSVACVEALRIRFRFTVADNGEKGCTRLENCSLPKWNCCHTNGCNAWANHSPAKPDIIKPHDVK